MLKDQITSTNSSLGKASDTQAKTGPIFLKPGVIFFFFFVISRPGNWKKYMYRVRIQGDFSRFHRVIPTKMCLNSLKGCVFRISGAIYKQPASFCLYLAFKYRLLVGSSFTSLGKRPALPYLISFPIHFRETPILGGRFPNFSNTLVQD